MRGHLRILLPAALAAMVLGAPVSAFAQGSPTDVIVRLERLEGQIRQLTGLVEQLQYRNQQLEQLVRRLQEDPRAAAQPAPPPPAPRAPAAAIPAAPPPAAPPPAPGRRSDAFDPTLDPSAPGAPRTLGAIPSQPAALPPPAAAPEPGVPPEPPIGAPGGRGVGTPLDLATLAGTPGREPLPSGGVPRVEGGPLPPPPPRPPATIAAVLPPSQTPKDEYDLAYGYVLRKDYALAEDQFRLFLKRYPSDRLIPDAHYWLGESLFQRQRYLDAAEYFLTVSTKYENAGKAPDALLRLGQSLAALGEKEQACAAFGRIGVKYPRASSGIKQGVEREQKRTRC